MEIIIGIIVGAIIGIGGTLAARQRKCEKGSCKCKSNEWVNWRPVDERMETPISTKGRATHNKISEDKKNTGELKKTRTPRKNPGKKKYYKKRNSTTKGNKPASA
jgi:hypothetical protein|tara:strand:+ start:2027 stop:2341 length:315 start_codon:yes stop_codon:yes gene_type:complete